MLLLSVILCLVVSGPLKVSCSHSFIPNNMAPTKEDLGRLEVSELLRELETLNLDTSGKKVELVERLWAAMQSTGDSEVKTSVAGAAVQSTNNLESKVSAVPSCEAGVPAGEVQPGARAAASKLMLRLKLIKERQVAEEDRIKVSAQAEQAELRLWTRCELGLLIPGLFRNPEIPGF